MVVIESAAAIADRERAMMLKHRHEVDPKDGTATVACDAPMDRVQLAELERREQSGRAARFLARLDDRLPALADNAQRRDFLDQQLAGWEYRYARFIATDGASEPVVDPADPPQAGDFLLTITGLAARRITLGNHGTGGNHE